MNTTMAFGRRVALCLILACAALSSRAEYLAKDGDTIAFMGDSITFLGNRLDGYIGLFMYAMEQLGVKDLKKIPAGVSGDTSVEMVKRMQTWVLANKPTIVTISCGVNDVSYKSAKPRIPLEQFRTNVLTMVDQTLAAGAMPVLMTPTPIYENLDNVFNKNLEQYIKCMYDIAAERKIRIADANAAFREDLLKAREAVKDNPKMRGANLLTVIDGVHMKYEGNKAIAWGLLKGFGVKDSQREQIEQFWREMPMLSANVLLTRDEFEAFKREVDDKARANSGTKDYDRVLSNMIGEKLRERAVEAGVLGQ